jgi:predicted  nucleic acid-binding Zn-ribbon protein
MPPRKADVLIPLQDLDLQIHKLKVQRAEKPRQLSSAEKKVAHAKDNQAAVQAEIKAIKLETAKRELTVKEFDGKIEKLQVQSMSAKKNEEYQAFQKEISGLKADKSRVEDGLLDLMMQSEEKAKLEKLRQEEVKAAEDEYGVAKKKLEAEMAVDDREIEAMLAKRAGVVASPRRRSSASTSASCREGRRRRARRREQVRDDRGRRARSSTGSARRAASASTCRT